MWPKTQDVLYATRNTVTNMVGLINLKLETLTCTFYTVCVANATYQKHGSVFKIQIFKAYSTWYLVYEVCFLASSFYSFMGETVGRCFYVCSKALATHVSNQSWPPNVIYLRITFVLLWASGRPTKLLLILKAMSYTFVLLCVLLWASIHPKIPLPYTWALQGGFFNWSYPDFTKCRSVRTDFKKLAESKAGPTSSSEKV